MRWLVGPRGYPGWWLVRGCAGLGVFVHGSRAGDVQRNVTNEAISQKWRSNPLYLVIVIKFNCSFACHLAFRGSGEWMSAAEVGRLRAPQAGNWVRFVKWDGGCRPGAIQRGDA